MTQDIYNTGLKEFEFEELDELLAQLPEENMAMDAAEADGFLTALQLLPDEVSPSEWMPMIFSATDTQGLLELKLQDRLEELVYRRYREIGRQLANCIAIDPIVFDPEDEDGNLLEGEDGIVALESFASGFLTAAQAWPGLIDAEDETVASALVGVWRHLPEELMGDFEEIRLELLSESPLEDLDDAINDLSISVAEVASITRGFKPRKEKKTAKKPVKKAVGGQFGRRR